MHDGTLITPPTMRKAARGSEKRSSRFYCCRRMEYTRRNTHAGAHSLEHTPNTDCKLVQALADVLE